MRTKFARANVLTFSINFEVLLLVCYDILYVTLLLLELIVYSKITVIKRKMQNLQVY